MFNGELSRKAQREFGTGAFASLRPLPSDSHAEIEEQNTLLVHQCHAPQDDVVFGSANDG
jgi:hypothetical protein